MSTAPRLVSLTDQQLSVVMSAASTLAPSDRGEFLEALAAALRVEPEIGDGVLARRIKLVIKPFFRPPSSTMGPQPHRNTGPAIE